MELSRQQVKTILAGAPPNVDKKQLLSGLLERGYSLEGFDAVAANNNASVQDDVAGNRFEDADTSNKGKTIIEKARNFATDLFGGKKLAQGAGMAIAADGVVEDNEDSQAVIGQAQSAIIRRIREKTAAGEDTARLKKALERSIDQNTIDTDVADDFLDALPSDKEVIGSAVRLSASLAAGKLTEAAAKTAGVGKAATVLEGAGRGAGAGAAVGAIEGALQSGGAAAEADKSTEELLTEGLIGGLAGAVLGGAVGAIGGGAAGAANKAKRVDATFVEHLVAPKQTTAIKEEAIRQGRLKDPGFLRKAEIATSKRDRLVAEAVEDVVSPKATIGQNIEAIRGKIDATDNGVRDYIVANKVPFNGAQLRTRLQGGKDDLELIFASDANAEKTYNAVVDAFMKEVSKKDTAGLFEARQSFDQLPAIKKLLETDKLGENARKEIVLAVRHHANDYIASLLPDGNPYKASMLSQRYALEALGNIAEKTTNVIGKNQLQLLTDRYPILKWVVGGAIAGTITGGVGAGSTFIGSSD